MSQFEKNYSNIYNLIYKKKNYKKEFLNIQRSLPKKIPMVKDILDIGCGTGLFAKYSFTAFTPLSYSTCSASAITESQPSSFPAK